MHIVTVKEFVDFWKSARDIDNTSAIGLGGVRWNAVLPNKGSVVQYYGEKAWEMIGEFYAPLWGNFDRTLLKEWLNQNRRDYSKFIEEEKIKIDLYAKKGLIYPLFCAISDETGTFGILADGSHRFIDCNYLIMNGKDLKGDIQKCRLDVLCVPNLEEVITIDMPSD